MRNKILPLLFVIFASTFSIHGQDVTIGSPTGLSSIRSSGFFDFSDPKTINLKVSVWGYVRYPGRYNIPVYTTPTDLLSYAGGTLDGADLEDIRIYRVQEDGTEEIIKLYYDDLVNKTTLERKNRPVVPLRASDILIIPGGPKYYFRDWLSITLSIFSALVSLTILILNINRN